MRKDLLVIGTFLLMMAGGAIASLAGLQYLMNLGMKQHDNYEYYGQTPAVLLILVAGIIGFAAPGIIVWRLHKSHYRVSLRTALVAVAVIAVVLWLATYAL